MTSPFDGLNVVLLEELRELDPDGSLGLLTEIVATYAADSVTYLRAMQKGMADQDAQVVARAAHTFKGASQTVGALGIAERLGAIELSALDGRLDLVAGHFDGLAELREATVAVLERWIGE